MALLIDGYNLLHVTDIFAAGGAGTDLHRTRVALLEYLAASLSDQDRKRTTIVFDAGGAPPGLPTATIHDGIRVFYARRHANADEMIEELLDDWKSPRSLTVVSSDHRVQRAARQHGANYIDSDKWFAELRAGRRERGHHDARRTAKPLGQPTPEETAYWLEEFTKRPEDGRKGSV
jgi:predicted RNA-binding protein with PIN domain